MKKIFAILFIAITTFAHAQTNRLSRPHGQRLTKDSIGVAIYSDTAKYYRSKVSTINLSDTTQTYTYEVVHTHPRNNIQSIIVPKSFTQKQADSVFNSKQ